VLCARTVIPSEYATITEYVGIAFVLAGIAVIGWGYAQKQKVFLPMDENICQLDF